MKSKRIVIANVIMAAFLALNIKLVIYPLGLVYAFLLLYAGIFLIIILIAMLAGGVMAYNKLKRKERLSDILTVIGCIGAFIGVKTVYKDYEGKERVYFTFSMMIWPFVIDPAVIAVLLFCTDLCWFPSV